ncbi:exodeoxyribonuclease III [Euzebya sp.]|uniref:exodeoxyribonuclease III n=1 Tax=Euzebya sp. TaxID=1971409 RepID=UPI0035129461
MRVATYNVNSLPARLPRLVALLDEHRPDVVLVQETKCAPEAFPHRELAEVGYLAADHSGGRWAGVAVLGRAALGVDDVSIGLPGEPDPDQARWVEATVGGVRFVSTYVPNGQRVGTPTFVAKLQFLDAMADRARRLAADGPTVMGGDLNVCPTDLDVWDPVQLHGGTHATDDERSRLTAIVDTGFVDTFRHHRPDEPGYTWWDYRAGHFHKGYGLRIDLVLATERLARGITAATVDREYRKPTKVRESKPSDHAPLLVDLDAELTPGPSATDDPVAAVADRAGAEQLGLL